MSNDEPGKRPVLPDTAARQNRPPEFMEKVAQLLRDGEARKEAQKHFVGPRKPRSIYEPRGSIRPLGSEDGFEY
jgi:hypothetical protein